MTEQPDQSEPPHAGLAAALEASATDFDQASLRPEHHHAQHDPEEGAVIEAADLPVEAGPGDPWAHRRGEPRIFAFLWTLYLLAAVVGSVMWLAGSASLHADAYGPAARIMLVAIAAGVTILWPMTRLCQEAPRSPLPACLIDVVVVIAPVQMVVWPLAFLASWPLDVIAATAALLAVWGVMAGGLLANALLDHPRREIDIATVASAEPMVTVPLDVDRRLTRAGWMVGIVGVVFTGQLLAALGVATDRPWLADLSGLSPFSGVYEVSGHGITGAERPVTMWQWRLIAGVGVASLLTWVLAVLRAVCLRARAAP